MDQPTADKYIYAAKHIYLTAGLATRSRGIDTPPGGGLLEWEIVEAEERFSDNTTLLAKVRDFKRYLECKIEAAPRENEREIIANYVLAAKYIWQNAVLFDMHRRKIDSEDIWDHLYDAMDETYKAHTSTDPELHRKIDELILWFHYTMLPEDLLIPSVAGGKDICPAHSIDNFAEYIARFQEQRGV